MDTVPTTEDVASPIDSRAVQWYSPDLTSPSPQSRQLFEDYVHIPPDQVTPHIHAVREKAWNIFPYPCIGQWNFLDLSISLHPSYPRLLCLLSNAATPCTLLDLGCCFGQDIRKLIHDGAIASDLYACDLKPEFLDLGHELFKDKGTCPAHFLAADVFHPNEAMRALEDTIDVIHTASFLHLFSWDEQLQVCQTIIGLLRPRKGSLVIGRQVGRLEAGEDGESKVNAFLGNQTRVWRHNENSFRKMWAVAGERTGTRWEVRVASVEWKGEWRKGWTEEGVRRLVFEVERVDEKEG